MQGKQFFPAGTPGDVDNPSAILVVKNSSGRYYALVEGGGANLQNVYDVTDVDNPVRQSTDFKQLYAIAAPTADRTAMVTSDGKLLIYNNDAFSVNGAPALSI